MSITPALLIVSLLSSAALSFSPSTSPPPLPFDKAAIFVETNATDGDAEVVVSVDAEGGLERFRIVSPCHQTVLDLRSNHTDDVGIRKIALETPEPLLAVVLQAYPEGWYTFIGRSTTGQQLRSVVWLSHDLPPAPVITSPLDGATNVPVSGARTTWTGAAGTDGFFYELESDDLGIDLKANLPAGTTSLGIPGGFLAPDSEYHFGLGARGSNGNLTVVEISFTTAP